MCEGRHVFDQYLTIDVCHDEVEIRFFDGLERSLVKDDAGINVISGDIFRSVFARPRVDVKRGDRSGSELYRRYRKNCRPGAGIQNTIAGWAGHNVNQLEEKQSSAREAVLAEIVDEREQIEKQHLAALARALIAALDEKERTQIESRVTVIATHGGMAAGRDQTINYAPPPSSKDEKSS